MGKQKLGRDATFFNSYWLFVIVVLACLYVLGVYLWKKQKIRDAVYRRKKIFTIGTILLVITSGMLILISTDAGVQFLDLSILRSRTLHNFFQTSEFHTIIPKHKELIVFQHLPRTAGDSMRTHAFHNLTIDYTPIWESKTDSPPKPYQWDSEITNNAAAIKGYWSKNDLDTLRSLGRPLKVFTFLRHPVERALSFYDFAGHGSAREFFDFSSPLFTDPEEGSRMYEHIASFVHNGMTWQYGAQMHINYRNISDKEVLERAKREIDRMDFVGFYENLGPDFWELRKIIFPDTEVPLVYPLAFYLGCIIGSPRFRVSKYSKLVDDETLNLVFKHVNLDMELYQYAMDKFNKNYRFYDNYMQYAMHNLFTILFVTFVFSLIVFSLVYCCYMLCNKNKSKTKNIKHK